MSYKPDGLDTAFGCATIMVTLFVKPWALMVLWGWYLVPLGVPDIGMLSAFGIALVASLLAHQYIDSPKAEDSAGWYGRAIAPIIGPLFVLALGAVARGIFS